MDRSHQFIPAGFVIEAKLLGDLGLEIDPYAVEFARNDRMEAFPDREQQVTCRATPDRRAVGFGNHRQPQRGIEVA